MQYTFLIGAGAEGEGQIGMSSGAHFKRKIILANGVREFAGYFVDNKMMRDGKLLTANSTNVLYQTIVEKLDDDVNVNQDETNTIQKKMHFDEKQWEKIRAYIDKKNSPCKDDAKGTDNTENNDVSDNESNVVDEFRKIYQETIYYKMNSDEEIAKDTTLEYFLDNAGIYSYADSLFNYLRKPNLYTNEVARVKKLYYGALKILWDDLRKKVKEDGKDEELFSEGEYQANRTELIKQLDRMQEKICTDARDARNARENKESQYSNLYYNIIRDFIQHVQKLNEEPGEGEPDASKNIVKIVTTNYTKFAEELTEINKTGTENEIYYLHGKLGLFESVDNKYIKKGNEFSEEDDIFPYLLVQSGVKPIINYSQLKEFYQGAAALVEADVLIVLGYGMNSDDEHVVNMLKERLEDKDKKKRTIFFIYVGKDADDEKMAKKLTDEKKRILKILEYNEKDEGENTITFWPTTEFAKEKWM